MRAERPARRGPSVRLVVTLLLGPFLLALALVGSALSDFPTAAGAPAGAASSTGPVDDDVPTVHVAHRASQPLRTADDEPAAPAMDQVAADGAATPDDSATTEAALACRQGPAPVGRAPPASRA